MNLIDIFIILFFISALVRGVELGLIRQICSTLGLFVGLFVGVIVQGKLLYLVGTPASKALLALTVIVAAIALFSSLGEYIGSKLKKRLEKLRFSAINTIDRSLGSIVAGASLLLFVWLGATIFANTPMSNIQKQIKGSVIIAELNKAMPPAPNIVARLGHLIDPNRFPNVFTGLEPRIDTDRPVPSIGELDSAVQKARAATVKIEGEGCGGISQGSGFVADTNLVITNAHVVAGVTRPYILDGTGRHPAEVIHFDPDLDMAVLRASNLAGTPLAINTQPVADGTPSAILGFPGGGDFTADPAVVIESFRAIGRDIYNQGETTREVYSIKANVQPGNSGGPLINKNGDVIGLIFAESTTYDEIGYALVTKQVSHGLVQAKQHNRSVPTGSCTQ